MRFWKRWSLALLLSGGILAAVLLPPFVSPSWQAVIMQAFASVCHQLPARSLHWEGVALAVCDRCLGIYGGVVVGLAVTPLMASLLRKVYAKAGWLLMAALTPVALDWVGPVIGLWPNTPASRMVTGGALGIGVGLLLSAVVARGVAVSEQQTTAAERSRA